MKINIPKVIIPVDFGGYAAELAGQFLQVWVNPPQDKLKAYEILVMELNERELSAAKQILVPDQPTGEPEANILKHTIARIGALLKIRKETPAQGLDVQVLEWYAEMWSQGPQATQWTAQELRELEQRDPACLTWMISQTWQARRDHVERKKKS
jgi:hypothetical protein